MPPQSNFIDELSKFIGETTAQLKNLKDAIDNTNDRLDGIGEKIDNVKDAFSAKINTTELGLTKDIASTNSEVSSLKTKLLIYGAIGGFAGMVVLQIILKLISR